MSIPIPTLTEALHWRYATKKFDPARKIPADTWAALEQALLLAPSSFGLQPWRFVLVQDPETRARLSAAAYGQRQFVDSSHLVVFAGRRDYSVADLAHYLDRIAAVRGVPRESLKGFEGSVAGQVEGARREGRIDAWMAREVYIALGFLLSSAALLGVDACPMEGLEPARFDEILGLGPLGYGTLCACALGYRSADDKYAGMAKVRFEPSEVFLRR
jgi:nitroreductase